MLLIADQEAGLLVDISLVRGTSAAAFTPSLKDLVMVTGPLTLLNVRAWQSGALAGNARQLTSAIRQDPVVSPPIAAGFHAPTFDTCSILKALIIDPCEELDMGQWRLAVQSLPK